MDTLGAVSPRIESEPGTFLKEVWVYLTPAEAAELLVGLEERANDPTPDPEWHMHVTDSSGRELTVAIETEAGSPSRHSS
jgi:hypothetical protein